MKKETWNSFFEELKKIRKIYQRGLPFVRNQTKGQQKGFRFRWYSAIEFTLKEGRLEEAKEMAIKELEFAKKYNSERTYFRRLKKVKELGIKI